MPNLAQKLATALHPSSRPSTPPGDKAQLGTPETKPPPARSAAPPSRPGIVRQGSFLPEPEAVSKTYSSCELFGMFKFLAAGKRDMGDFGGDVDSDEDEEGQLVLDGEQNTETFKTPRPEPLSLPEESLDDDAKTIRRPSVSQQQQWLEELGDTMQQRDTLSSRFTALSLSNLSPYGEEAMSRKKRPELPRFSSHAEESDSELSEDTLSTPSTGITTPAELADQTTVLDTDEPSDEQKLAAVIEEFGDIASLMERDDGEGSEPERLLAESKGSLFKGVMMIGNLHLTTHRILFHALLPPDAAFVQDSDKTPSARHADQAMAAAARQPDILHSGPITVHRSGALKLTRRVWLELSAEMVTTYPNGDEAGRVRPLRCILLSSVRRLAPLDPKAPCDFHISYDSVDGLHSSHFTVDTEQSAVQWRRAFESALFRHARLKWRRNEAEKFGLDPNAVDKWDHWTMLRICIPLDRVEINGISDYHGFATLVGLDVELDDASEVSWHPEHIAQGDFTGSLDSTPGGRRKQPGSGASTPKRTFSIKGAFGKNGSGQQTPPPSSPLKQSTYIDSTLPPRLAWAAHGKDEATPPGWALGEDWRQQYTFNVAVLNEQAWFAEALQSAVHASAGRKYKAGIKRPRMVMEVAGYDCLATDEEVEAQTGALSRTSTSSSEAEDEETGFANETRKAEKAALAAKVFGLREDEGIYLKRCYIGHHLLPDRGHIIITPRYICFWRRVALGSDIKYRFQCSDVKRAVPAPAMRAAFHGMALQIHGHRDLRFEFWKAASRDEVMNKINSLCVPTPAARQSTASDLLSDPPQFEAPSETASSITSTLVSEPERLVSAEPATMMDAGLYERPSKRNHTADILAPPKESMFQIRTFPDEALGYMPFIANKPWAATSKLTPRTFAMLTIGSRGDVQPYIALALRLKKDGHRVVIVTHDEFRAWVEGYGIEHRQAGGDPTALMKLSAEHRMFSPGFFKETLGSFRQWLDELLVDSWEACKDADVLIESPSAMAGVHIAEARKIPYFRAFTMPWTRTQAYPQAFMVPAFEMGPSFNYSTYVLFDNIIWKATAGQINRWRKTQLNLKSTDMSTLSVTKVPFLYNFSSAVVPKPLDWHDDITITGYWNLEDSDTEWSPPEDLERFMAKAKEDGKALVYIGFGSIVVPRPNAMTKSIIKAVEKAGVRAIIAKGWSSRGGDPAKEGEHIQFPDSCYGLDKVPHSWLFPKVQAALHHGGAGTVGASLRAGVPTLIKPWFGDQYFWAIRVTRLGAGLRVPSLRSEDIADALRKATTDHTMIEKAARIGERIRKENGVDNAVNAIHYNIVRAASDRSKMQWAK